MSNLTTTFYLVVTRNGAVDVYKKTPSVRADQVSVRCQLQIPQALFERPHLSATIVVPEEAARPTEISAEVLGNWQEAIQQATGLDIQLSVLGLE
ncbi:MAG TPA: hypothetical protein VGE45_01065 [Chloroflexia bacterium]|jgi:S-adenosylmethionine synthetase